MKLGLQIADFAWNGGPAQMCQTLAEVARAADACNLYPGTDLARKLDVLRQHCEAEGRDYGAIEKSCTFHFSLDPGAETAPGLIQQLRLLAAAGIDTVIGIVRGPRSVEVIERLRREVVPEVG